MRRILMLSLLFIMPSTALAQQYLLKGAITDGSTLFPVSKDQRWTLPWELYGDPTEGYPINYVARLGFSPIDDTWSFQFAAMSSIDGNQTHTVGRADDASTSYDEESLTIGSFVSGGYQESFNLDLDLQAGTGSWNWLVDCPACFLLHPLPSASATVSSIDFAPSADFNEDGFWDTSDIDALMTEIAMDGNDPRFDLSGDAVIDSLDRDLWLAEAAQHNGFSSSYLLGDANLDGVVNSTDMGPVGVNWQSDATNWSSGNFVGKGVRSNDLTLLGLNWQGSVPHVAAVPEPTSAWVWLVLALLIVQRYRRV